VTGFGTSASDFRRSPHARGGLAKAKVMRAGLISNRRAQKTGKLFGACTGPQRGSQIERMVAEKAESQAAVGRQAHAIAAIAIVVRERTNHADRTHCTGKAKYRAGPLPCGPAPLAARR